MNIEVSYDKEFAELLDNLRSKYGAEIFEIEGIGSQLDLNKFSREFFSTKVCADTSIDANANVGDSSIVSYSVELAKPYEKLNSLYLLWKEMRKLYHTDVANKLIEMHISGDIYIHDLHSVIKPYCANYSTYDIMNKGIPMVTKIHCVPPNHLYSFKSQLEQFVVIASNNTLGACMHKDQRILVKRDGLVRSITSKDFIEEYDLETKFVQNDRIWYSGTVRDNACVYENGKYVPIKRVFKSPYVDDIYTITTKTGKQCKVNKHHIFKVLRNKNLVEVEAKDLCIYDTIINTLGGVIPIDKNSEDYRHGQFIGILCGDGCLTQKYQLSIAVGHIKESLMDWMDNYLNDYYPNIYTNRYYDSNKHYWNYFMYDKINIDNIIDTYFDRNKLYGNNKYPINLNNKSLEFKIGFLDGLFVTDGSASSEVLELTLCNKDLIDIVHDILLECGITKINRGVYHDSRPNKSVMYRLSFSKSWRFNFTLFNDIKVSKYNNLDGTERVYFGKYAHKKPCSIDYQSMGSCSRSWKSEYTNDEFYDIITDISIEVNDNDYVYEIETDTHWYSCGGILTHNTGIADTLIVMSYYVKNILNTLQDAHFTFKDESAAWIYIKESICSLIYTLNQPFRSSLQAAFTNISIYDEYFLRDMTDMYIFEDGSTPDINIIKKLQDIYLDVMNENMHRTPVIFPVTTACFSIDENKEFKDINFVKYIIEKNKEFGFINLFSGKSSILSSCCRLKSDMESIGYSNSIGGSSTKIGSIGVTTINMYRLAKRSANIDEFKILLKEMVGICARVNHARRTIIRKKIESGFAPLYTHEFISLDKQFSTCGINAFYEAMCELNVDITLDDGLTQAIDIIDIINHENKKYDKLFGYQHNNEQIPGESASVKIAHKDKILGYNTEYELYSNQFIPLTASADILERIKIQGALDSHFSGGSILHLNFDKRIEDTDKIYNILQDAVRQGVVYMAINYVLNECEDGHMSVGNVDCCPTCTKEIVNEYSRVVGFLSNVKNWNKVRRTFDFPNRKFYEVKN